MAKKKGREITTGGVTIAAILSVLIGVLLAVVQLAARPVEVVTKLPEEENRKPGKLLVLRGTERNSSQWQLKAGYFVRPRIETVRVNEGELNAWSSRNLKLERDIPAPKAGEEVSEPFVQMEPPNFRIMEDGRLQILTNIRCSLLPDPVLFRVMGKMKQSSQGFYFVAQEGSFGNTPVPALVNKLIYPILQDRFESREGAKEIVDAWSRVEGIEMGESQMVFQLKPTEK